MSSRRIANIGLVAACLLVISSLVVLHSGASEARRAWRGQPLSAAPDFILANDAGEKVSLSSKRGSTVVLAFCAVSCPVSNDYQARIASLAKRYAADSRVSIITINTGHGLRAAGGLTPLAATSMAMPSPVRSRRIECLLDPTGSVARSYAMEVTPTFLIIDPAGVIRYRGSFDDNRNSAQARATYCDDALQQVLHGLDVEHSMTTAFGCKVVQ